MLPFIAAAASVTAARADVPSVAVDIAPIHSLVAHVIAGVDEPDLILPPGATPHSHALRPSEARVLPQANVFFWIGPELTPWLEETIPTLAPQAATVELLAAARTTERELRENAIFEPHDHDGEGDHDGEEGHDGASEGENAGEEDHGEDHGEDHAADAVDAHAGHDHGTLDPHAWLDPSNAGVWLEVVATELSKADPGNADAYRANAAARRAEIAALVAELDGILAPVRGGSFIVFNDAYQYFEEAFGFPAAGAILLSDAARPSPARVEEIRRQVAEAGVTCVLAEPQFNPDLVDTVLD